LLEIPPSAESSDIKAAYRRKALALHPDVNPAPDAAQRFAEVSSAYGARAGH
jgi:curved DNA-binding protein CbpA